MLGGRNVLFKLFMGGFERWDDASNVFARGLESVWIGDLCVLSLLGTFGMGTFET